MNASGTGLFCTMAGALLLAIAATVTAMVGHGPAAKAGYSPVNTPSFASVAMEGVRGAPATVGGVEAQLVDVTAHDRNVKAASAALTACKKSRRRRGVSRRSCVIAAEEARYGTPRTTTRQFATRFHPATLACCAISSFRCDPGCWWSRSGPSSARRWRPSCRRSAWARHAACRGRPRRGGRPPVRGSPDRASPTALARRHACA